MKRKYLVLLAMLLVLSLVFVACGQDSTTEAPATEAGDATEDTGTDATEEPADDTEEPADSTSANPAATRPNADTLIIGTAKTDGVFNPIYYSTAYDGYVVEMVFDSLLSNNDAAEFTPAVAESWEISEDGKEITFKLREDVYFSDGEQLTAEDVVFTYQAMADPSYEGRYGYIPASLAGYEEYQNSIIPEEVEEEPAETEEGEETEATEATDEATEAPGLVGEEVEYAGVTANGDFEVTFHFTEAKATNLGDTTMGILPAHIYAYEPGQLSTMTQMHGQPVGSGPYKLTNVAPDEYIEFEANEEYFLGAPKIKNLIMRYTAKETELNAFESGEYDILDSVENTPESAEVIGAMEFAELVRYDNNGYAYIGLNMDNPNLAKKEVRQALIYGFDRYAFVEDFFAGAAVVPNVPFARVSWVFTPELEENINKYEYNPDKAIELLESVGYTEVDGAGVRSDGTNELKFNFLTYTDTLWTETLVNILKDEWMQIGVELNENFQEWSGFSNLVYNERDFDMYTMAWSLTLDPSPRGIFHSENIQPNGNNSVGWDNPENDRLLEEGELELDQEQRKVIYTEWGELWNEELPYIPVYMRENWQLINDRVEGFEVSPYVSWRNRDVLLNLELVD